MVTGRVFRPSMRNMIHGRFSRLTVSMINFGRRRLAPDAVRLFKIQKVLFKQRSVRPSLDAGQ